MKKLFYTSLVLLLLQAPVFAQSNQIGISGGISNFLGDVGKKPADGKFYFGDVEASLFRPAFGVFYKHGFNKWVAVRGSLTYGRLEGNDRLSVPDEFMDDAWFRNYRNLHFKSHIIELAVVGEVNLMPYLTGSTKKRFAPYLLAGVALFNFDPRATYNGETVRLRPLGTEGQGMPGYAKKYSLIQPAFPVGFGLKYNITNNLTVALEFGHRFTLTDYMDDVSTVYPDKADIFKFYQPETAKMVYELSRRSPERDVESIYGHITESGQQRGNPGGKDAYLFSMFSVSYVLRNKSKANGSNPMDNKNEQRIRSRDYTKKMNQKSN